MTDGSESRILASSRSAGGQLEQLSEVNNSTRTGAFAPAASTALYSLPEPVREITDSESIPARLLATRIPILPMCKPLRFHNVSFIYARGKHDSWLQDFHPSTKNSPNCADRTNVSDTQFE